MGSNYEQLFHILTPEAPPAYLCERILVAVGHERVRRGRTQLFISSLTGISSLAGLMFALPGLLRAADATGFSSYLPLMISDSDVISSQAGTFFSTLLAALPGFEVTLTLFLLSVFLVSVKSIVQNSVQAHLSIRQVYAIIHFRSLFR